MKTTVALRKRGHVATLLNRLLHEAGQERGLPDRRNVRTFRQLVLGVLIKQSTRLLALGQVVAPARRVQSVKAAAMALGYFLAKAQVPLRPLALRLGEAALRSLDPAQLVTYQGKVLLVIDPTEYAKHSRGKGTRGRHMQYIGRVRQTKGTPRPPKRKKQGVSSAARPRPATTFGSVDIWAGVVLCGKRFLPLARQLFSNRHPHLRSQNRVEEAVLGQALAVLRRVGLEAIVVGDRGLGRKELIVHLARARYDVVLRIDPDITLLPSDGGDAGLVADLLADRPVLGTVIWERGQQGNLLCQVRTLHGTIQFSRSGRKADVQEATITVVQLVPEEEGVDPLVLITTLPVQTLAQARAIAGIYAQRWSIETAFQTMHAWGQDAFMVRSWRAIERLLWWWRSPTPWPRCCCWHQPVGRSVAKLASCSASARFSGTISRWANSPKRSAWTTTSIAAPGDPYPSPNLLELEYTCGHPLPADRETRRYYRMYTSCWWIASPPRTCVRFRHVLHRR